MQKAINEGKAPVDSLGVKAVDEHTFEVELENPIPYFSGVNFFLLRFYPQNEKFIKQQGEQFGKKRLKQLFTMGHLY
ncbi:hypothetical protein GCM10020331_050600 [Ectobacillus funiculus]